MRYREFIREDNEQQKRLSFIVDQMQKNPSIVNQVYRLIKVDIAKAEKNDPASMIKPEYTGVERDYTYKGVLPAFIKAIEATPGDYNDIEEFLKSYGNVSYINTDALMTDGFKTWDAWLQGQGNVQEDFISALYDNLYPITLSVSGSNRGPGEVGLALLSPDIQFASVGDLKIDGVEVEVKAESSSGGGRMKNSNADYGQPNLKAVYNKFKIPKELIPKNLPTGNIKSTAGTHFLDIAQQLEQISEGAGTAYLEELFFGTFKYGDKEMMNTMIKLWKNMDRSNSSVLAQKISYSNYANVLKNKGFSKFIFLKKNGKKTLTFDVDDYENYIDKFKMQSLAWNDKINGPAVQVSML